MPQPIDVGSVLGGRYKVTARLLASAENDVILDGIDQVLNRPVSILVAAPENSAHLTQSAREVATGERAANVSILDLGTADNSTYLIASRVAPAELLDLVVPTEQPEEAPYQEPFFTDTLGTEIFGSPRDASPAQAAYVYEDDSPVPAAPKPRTAPIIPPPPVAPPVAQRPVAQRPITQQRPAAQPPVTQPPAARPPAQETQAAAVVPPVAPAPAEPKVTLWNEDDYGFINTDHDAAVDQTRKASAFPASARQNSDFFEDVDASEDVAEEDDNAPRTSGRWLTGGIVAILVIAALIFAVTNISTLFGGNNAANTAKTTAEQSQTSAQAQSTTPKPVAPVVAPVIGNVTIDTPGDEGLLAQFNDRLKNTFDSNPATYWPTLEFSDDSFANMTSSINLIVQLSADADISTVTISQIGGTGGNVNILTNNSPSLTGATKIASGSFNAPNLTIKAPAGTKAKYVILNFTQLPKLQPFVTYPYGLKIAEISIK